MFCEAIHESAGGQHSPTYAHQHHAGVNAHNVPTFRGSVGTESIGEHLCVVTRIGAEHDGAMSIVFGSRRPAENLHPELRIACSEAVFDWCLLSGRLIVGYAPFLGEGICYDEFFFTL